MNNLAKELRDKRVSGFDTGWDKEVRVYMERAY